MKKNDITYKKNMFIKISKKENYEKINIIEINLMICEK